MAFDPPGEMSAGDPLGTVTKHTLSTSVPIPAGSYAATWIEAKLSAAAWLEAARSAAKIDAADTLTPIPLPGTAAVALRYAGKTGEVEIERAELLAAGSDAPNLLANGSFESLAGNDYPLAWSRPQKYRYFPPKLYYIFNTWHHSDFDNRGPVAVDRLISADGGASLKMIVAAGDEKAIVSEPIMLRQNEPRLIEVSARIKTDQLCFVQIDAIDEHGQRLDGFNFIHKAPDSIGSDEWRLIRQVFRPRQPVESIRLMLCARASTATRSTTPASSRRTAWWARSGGTMCD